jgi:UDP-N-acetylmuramoyl-L-alanyl-D-glutamate--2,6-diaminopimelate ligase
LKGLTDILAGVKVVSSIGEANVTISSLFIDSREVKKGGLFVAVRGTLTDGHLFIPKAIENGAVMVICEEMPDEKAEGVCYIKVADSSIALGKAASNFYDNPSSKFKLVGITGTNGKTSIATMLHELYKKLGYKAGLISTVVNKIGDTEIESTHTTPDAISINRLMDEMVDAGCTYCFMEVSSHAIHQERVGGLHFAGGVFTNITHDHLDYHKTFKEYIKAKKKFFDDLSFDAFALTNRDDKNGKVMLQNCAASQYNYGLKNPADFKVKILEADFNGMLLDLDGNQAWFNIMGHFNAYNLVAVYAVAFLLGEDREKIITVMSSLGRVQGRFETVVSPNKIVGIIDYAHTPDALNNVLKAINEIRTTNEQLITVVGCGGNRDKEKRPAMGDIASRYSDKVIFTADNPRDEDPLEIVNQMSLGVDARFHKRVLNIIDRKEAIRTAVMMAQPNDIILVAGKGHETYQEIKGEKLPFDDRDILVTNFEMLDR